MTIGPSRFQNNGHIHVVGNIYMAPGQHVQSAGRLHISGPDNVVILNKHGLLVSKHDGASGNLHVGGNLTVDGDINIKGLGNPFIGVAQSWHDVTNSRGKAVTYTNNTGRPIMVNISVELNGWLQGDYDNMMYYFVVDGIDIAQVGCSGSSGAPYSYMSGIVPAGSTYAARSEGKVLHIKKWAELR
jgi:hypothetical protein